MSSPNSSDPIDFDYYVNHRIFRSVMATIVTSNATSDAVPYLADSWISESEDKVWTFNISNNFFFEDGSPINSNAIRKSLLRLQMVLDKRKSKNIIFENLEQGGIVADGNKLVLRFKHPMPRALYHLGFGVFGIVSETDYDEEGNWKNQKKINSSGPYRIFEWGSDGLSIVLKDHYPQIGVKRKLNKISFVWSPESITDLVVGNSDSELKGYDFVGPIKSGFNYIHCYSWNDPNNLLYSKNERIKLRNYIYDYFNKSGLAVSNELFPVTPHLKMVKSHQKNIEFDPRWKGLKFSNSKIKNTKRAKAFDAFLNENKFQEVEVEGKDFDSLLDPKVLNKKADCRLSSSGIHLDSPIDDLKFMFLSKEGIALPDPTGRIRQALNSQTVDLTHIEELIWEDAIVFPISHHSIGLWHKTNLDFSQLNPTPPPIDFSWVGVDD